MKKIMQCIKEWFLLPFSGEESFVNILLWLLLTWMFLICGFVVVFGVGFIISVIVIYVPWLVPVACIPLLIGYLVYLFDKKYHNVVDSQR